MAFSLQEALEQIRSDKVKDRQQGLEAIDHIFADAENVRNLDPKHDGRAWLKTFQSLFACVLAEKTACIRKGSFVDAQPTALARLQRAAQTLRSLVDKSASLLTRKVVKALVIHIHQMLNHRGTLLQPIAPAYIAALCTILRYPHHVDHLDPEDWSAVASLCFDILLTRELCSDPATPADAQQWLASSSSAQPPPLQRRGLSLEHAGTAECLSHLISSGVAPLLGPHGYGLPFLADYVRFLLAYPSESSAHLPTLTGLVVLLEHLELNHTSEVVLATLAVRHVLLGLWKTKNHLLKAQLLLLFRIVTDPIASCALARPDAASSQQHAFPSDDAIAFLHVIHDTLLNDPDSRWALEPLHIDALLLRWPQHSQPVHRDTALGNAAFSLSPTSSDKDALAWCRIGLQVDLIDALITVAARPIDRSNRPATSDLTPRDLLDDHTAGPSTQATTSPAKRRRTTPTSSPQKRSRLGSRQPAGLSSEAQALTSLIDMLSHNDASAPSSPAARLSAVQLLTFLVLGKPHLLTPTAIDHLQKCLLALIADTDTATVSWSLLALASIMLIHSTDADDASRQFSATQGWVIAARKLQLPATSRAAAHLLSVLLVSSALPDSKLQPEISRLLADVDLQGPPIVCDSVCHLMALLLRHTTSSRAFNHLDPRAKIGAWFTSTYFPAATLSSSASHGPFVPYDDLIRLIDRIVAEGDPQSSSRASLHATSSIPGAAFVAAQRRARLQPLRDLVLRSSIGHASLSDTTVQCEATAATPVLMSAEALHRMTVVLDRNVDACLHALQDLSSDSNGGASLTSHAAITALHLAILALDVGSRSTSQHRKSSIRCCCQIIVRVLATASSVDGVRSGTYTLAIEQLTLLSPSATFISDTPTTTDLLVEPGPRSGIAARSVVKEQPEQTRSEHNAIDESSRRIWKAIRDADMLDTMLASCAKLFETTLFGDDEAEAEPSSQVAVATGDIFDDVPESSSSTLLNATAAAHVDPSASVEVVIRSTVRLLLTVPRIVTGAADTRHQELVVSSFFDCSVQGIVALAPVLFDSFRDGTLWMSHRDVNDALDRLGTELLASYRFARHPAARLAAIRAVSCVMPLLLGELDEQSDLFDKVQKLSAFFADQIGRTKWPTPWEVQLACADFLAERLRLDPDGRLLRSGTARAPSASPVTALFKLHADPDVRVRALGSPIATSVVSAFAGTEADLDELYTIFRDGLPSDSTQPRLILTRALSLCNAAIASSSVRRSSIFYLLEIVLATGMLSSTVQELFAKLAARLGFPDASSCYQAFAGQITWGLATNGYDPLQLPWKVLGYASKRACLEATFAACGSMLLATQTADGRTQFDALVQLTRRNRQQGLQECLPFLTAAYIGFAAHAEQGTPSNSAAICERTLRDLASLGVVEGDDSATLNEMIVQADDLTISTLLLLFYQPGTTLADSRTSILEALAPLDAKCAKTVEALTPTTDDGAASCHEPSRPFFSAAVLYTALAALPQLGIAAFAPQTVYNVLRHMFYHISASRFVNDQVRMCAALRIYIAMCGDAFWKDALNNQLLIRSIERLLEQPQLHDELRPLLVYAGTASCLATKAPEPLVSCIVTWSQQLAERLVASPASGAWLLEAANALARSSPVATSAVVLLWPVDLANTEHTAVESLVDIGTLTYALEACPTLSPRLPSLLRIRAVLTRADKAQLAAFCNGPAWKLLERAASAARERIVQIAGDPLGDVINDIFTAIVGVQEAAYLHREARRLGGKWNPQAVEDFLEAADTSNIRTLSAAAILTVHQLAQDLPIEQGYEAYGALRAMAAVLDEPLAEVHPAKMPAAARQELSRVRPGLGPPLPAPRVAVAQDVMDAELVDIASSADKWLCRMAAILCDLVASMPHLALFRPARRLVEANPEAAHALFPILLLYFTADDAAQEYFAPANEKQRRSGGSGTPSRAQRDQGLAATRAVVAQHFEAVLGCTSSDPACSEIIVQALLALRAFRPVQSEPDNVCFWYRLDPNLLASRCIAAGQLTAAIFFLEHSIQNATEKPQVAMLRSANQLLHQAYMNIDDPDAFYGITDGDVRDSVLMRLHHEGQWLRAFQYQAADYEACASDAERRRAATTLGQSLQHLGFPRLVEGIGLINAGEVRFASATDLGGPSTSSSWDLPLASQTLHDKASSVEGILHTLRQASAEQDVDAPLSHAFRSKLQALCSTSVESAKALRSLQGDLLALGQIKDWRRASSSMGAEEAVAHLRSQWVRVEASERFELTERVLDTRQSVLDAVRQRMHVDQIGDVLDGPVEDVARVERLLLVSSSRRAREHGKLQKAINAVARAQRIEDALGDGEELAREEFAAVLWDQNEHSPAIQLLSQVVDGIGVTQSSSSSQKRRAARLLALLAQWRATARSQQPREIDRSLFEPALKLTAVPAAAGSNGESTPAAAEQSEIAYRWARFAEQHHRDSDLAEITRLRLYTDRRREEIAQNQRECERTSSKTERSKLLQYQRQAEKILLQDETRLTELEASRTHFLRRSVAMYARALATSDEHDDAVPRLVSLWMEHAADAELNRLLSTCLPSIPSHKFVGLMHQLSARLTELPDAADVMVPFQTNLSRLLLRMCQEHPFHCLYAIFALIKTGADAKAAATHRPSSRNTLSVPESGASQSASPPVLRSTAAEKIWTHIKRRSSLGKRIRTFEELCLAYVEWAEFDLTSRADRYFQNSGSIKKGALRMPPSGELRLARMRDLDIPVATARLEIDVTCRYENFVSIVRYGETFTTAGGIHLPKISECIGSDGRRYKQLFKRDDDLRQDAVMQQVFRMVNGLLEADRRTRERNLAIRTYTVLPLGPQCGLLEFVTNTLPLGEVLIELHARYRPQDITPAQARAKLRDAQTMRAEAKLEAFLDVCQAMQPAMRYFFSDAQRMPRDWYATRLRYTRSVSTNSIVGHVLGLGDRHVSNILLDQASGELVHIDFGVAFDQGKLLPIPELVPFRLTRDLVDGMGVHGVEGTFRRCCEETLRVLRAHGDAIKTVLEVFRHDPLFAWTSNPIKVLRAQEAAAAAEEESVAASMDRSGSTAPSGTAGTAARARLSRSTTPMVALGDGVGDGVDTAELSADRAVSSVMSKLSSSLSVESTVNDLIQQAMDAGNLSAIFHGWQAAL